MEAPYASSAPGRFLQRWQEKHAFHPESFDCGLRVLGARGPGTGSHWRVRRSAVDRLIVDRVVTLYHGSRRPLRLCPDWMALDQPAARAALCGQVVFAAFDWDTGERLQLSVAPYELERFGIDADRARPR